MTINNYLNTEFSLDGKVCVVTGALGLLGVEHCLALVSAGAIIVMVDIHDQGAAHSHLSRIQFQNSQSFYHQCDVSVESAVVSLKTEIINRLGRIDVLVNNAAINPKVTEQSSHPTDRMETYPIDQWNRDLAVGLTGAMLCSREIGSEMVSNDGGVILNIASDLALVAPDQRIYELVDRDSNLQPRKSVSYSVVKAGLLGLTRYLATYWPERNVRCNALAPGGVYNGQNENFVLKLSNLIPLGRMANRDEYRGVILFMCSDASRYMNGAVVSIDGGRTAW